MEPFTVAIMTFIYLFVGRFINIRLTKYQNAFIQSDLCLHLFIYSIAYMSCKDFKWSLFMYVVFMLILKFATNHNSKLSFLPKKLLDQIDTNKDGEIDDQELTNAIELLNDLYHKKHKLGHNLKKNSVHVE